MDEVDDLEKKKKQWQFYLFLSKKKSEVLNLWLQSGASASGDCKCKWFYLRKSKQYVGLAPTKRPTSTDPEFFGFQRSPPNEVLTQLY